MTVPDIPRREICVKPTVEGERCHDCHACRKHRRRLRAEETRDMVFSYATLQWSTGGLLDGKLTGRPVCLVMSTWRGTPGPTLCGLDRFSKEMPGWSVGGGLDQKGQVACPECLSLAQRNADTPVAGMLAELFGWERSHPAWHSWGDERPKRLKEVEA